MKKVYNLIVLDESGSMSSVERATVSGLNETIQSIKTAQAGQEGQEHFLSLLSFNSERMFYHYDLTPVSQIREFTGEDYCPSGCTPLYDAIGSSIAKLRRQLTDDDMVLVTIITDGLENSSKEYNYHSLICLMDTMKAKGWTIGYIGANQDALAEAHRMHIDNGLSYDATPEGVENMLRYERINRNEAYCEMAICSCPEEMKGYDYFKKNKKDKSDKNS